MWMCAAIRGCADEWEDWQATITGNPRCMLCPDQTRWPASKMRAHFEDTHETFWLTCEAESGLAGSQWISLSASDRIGLYIYVVTWCEYKEYALTAEELREYKLLVRSYDHTKFLEVGSRFKVDLELPALDNLVRRWTVLRSGEMGGRLVRQAALGHKGCYPDLDSRLNLLAADVASWRQRRS